MMTHRACLFALCTGLLLGVFLAACGNDSKHASSSTTERPLVASAGEIATPTALPDVPPPDEVPPGLDPVWEAYSLLAREYVDRTEINPDDLAEAAIRGMVAAIDDRYTAYVSPDSFRLETQSLQGDFEGIGAEVQSTRDGKRIMIIAPLPETPAEQAGIRPGDTIMAVDGEDTEGWSVLDAVRRIRGPGGTTVTLTVIHLGDIDEVDIPIVRGKIKQNTVTARMLEEEPYSVLKISTFTARTKEEVRTAIKDLKSQGTQGIVLDLRANPGGLLTSTVDVTSEFLNGGLVTYEIDGQGNRKDWQVRSGGTALDIPLVVLVNEFSASGSEVLTAALQDHDRAVVIGKTTFGKGSVNMLRPLSNGGGLYITFARWYSPKGRLIEGDGIEPDVIVDYDPTFQAARHGQEDTQLRAAIEQLDFESG